MGGVRGEPRREGSSSAHARREGSSSAQAALITGGGSGIGAATARRLTQDGWLVCVCGRRSEPLEALADETGALAVAADTRDQDAVHQVVQRCLERFGRLDGLVLAAGVGASGAVGDQTLHRWQTVIDTNLTGAFLACKAALPHLLKTSGSIVTIASLAGLRAGPESAAYCSSKAALVMLTQCIALDYAAAGLRANCICPGWIRTAMADGEMDELARRRGLDREGAYALATAAVPARREGSAQEVAAAVAWLLSSEASYVNGAVLTVDGGAAIVDAGSLAFARDRLGQPDARHPGAAASDEQRV